MLYVWLNENAQNVEREKSNDSAQMKNTFIKCETKQFRMNQLYVMKICAKWATATQMKRKSEIYIFARIIYVYILESFSPTAEIFQPYFQALNRTLTNVNYPLLTFNTHVIARGF